MHRGFQSGCVACKDPKIMDEDELLLFRELNDTSTNFSESLTLNGRIFLSLIFAFAFVTGIFWNIISSILIGSNRSMRTRTNYFLLCLYIFDMLLLIFGLPLEVHQLWTPYLKPLEDETRMTMGVIYETAANAIVLTITAVSFEKYIAMKRRTLHMRPKLSRLVRYIIAIWICALCFAICKVMQFGILTVEKKEHGAQEAFVIPSFICFIGHMTLMAVLYLLIFMEMHTSKDLGPVKQPPVERGGRSNGVLRFKRGASQRRVIKMLFALVLSYFLLLVPYHVQRLLSINGKDMKQTTDDAFDAVYAILKSLSGGAYVIFAALNPILFYILSEKFRNAFKVTLTSWCRRRNRFQLERTDTAVLDSERTLQRPRHQRQQQRLRPDFCPLHGVPAQAQSLNRSNFNNLEHESRLWRQQIEEGPVARVSPESISNSSLRELDEDQNRQELATYLYQIDREIIEERVTTV